MLAAPQSTRTTPRNATTSWQCATVGSVRCAASLVLMTLAFSAPAACGPDAPKAPAKASAETPVETKAEPAPSAEPTATATATDTNQISFVLDGEDRLFEVREPGHATINRLSAPPTMAILARAPEGSTETLMIKLGGVDLDHAKLPLTLRRLAAGGPMVSWTYVDPAGVRSTGQVDTGTADDHLTIEAWDPTRRHLRGTFTFTLETTSPEGPGSTRRLTRGSFNVVLQDPFDR